MADSVYLTNPFGGGGSGGITIGTTTITGGTDTRVLYDNAGVVGEYAVTGTGTTAVLSTAPTLTGPVTVTGAVGSSALTITGGTQTADNPALNLTQTWNNAGVTFTGVKANITDTTSATASLLCDLQVGASSRFSVTKAGLISFGANPGANVSKITPDFGGTGRMLFTGTNINMLYLGEGGAGSGGAAVLFLAFSTNPGPSAADLLLVREGAAILQMGADVNGAAVAQTFKAHDGITGTDRAGANLTIAGGRGTGAGAPGDLIWQTATALSTGTTAQTLATRLTLSQATLTFADEVNLAFNTTTGTKIGTGTTQKIGFYNATPIAQGASVADPTGGATVDAEARTAISALISRIEALGLIATV